jgi:hypothetical protein
MSKPYTLERVDLQPGEVLVLPPPGMRVLRKVLVEYVFFGSGPSAGPSRAAGRDPLADLDRSITDLTIKRVHVNSSRDESPIEIHGLDLKQRLVLLNPDAPPSAGPQRNPSDAKVAMALGPGAPVPLGCEGVLRLECTFKPAEKPEVKLTSART